MKKNLSLLMLFGLIMAIFFSACKKLEYTIPLSAEDSRIMLKSSSAATVDGGTIYVQMRTMCAFSIETSLSVSAMQVKFEDGSYVVPNNGYFEKNWEETGLTWLTITILDQNNQAYSKTYYVKVVTSLQEPVVFIAVDPIVGTNFFSVRLALLKNGLPLGSGAIAYTGSVTNPPWSTVYFLAADTNYRLKDNTLIPATGSEVGDWLGLSMQLLPGDYQMGAGRMNNGSLIWGDFMGSDFVSLGNKTMIEFTLTADGKIISNAINSLLPGSIGDSGFNAVVRFSADENGNWILYVNNGESFSSLSAPFVKLLSDDGSWNNPVLQSPVTDFPNWGKITIPYPIPDIIKYHFGSDVHAHDDVNVNMPYSKYWNSQTGVLETILVSQNVN
ncbi:hypothetical protein JXE04_01695 [Patescibacteria group bacterium]|nr:hypothetical protein [Patescibacteria group bacterium]